MAGYPFGFGSPISSASLQSPFGSVPYGAWGVSTTPFAVPQQYGQQLQQILQILQIVPQQLQYLQHLQSVQQQQLQQVQQLLQVVPAQLAQLQQLIQFVPQQIHQQMHQSPQLQQPFGATSGPSGLAGNAPWAITPQVFGQSGQVM
jgi:hypothetical protein